MGTYSSGFGFSEMKKHKGGFAVSYIVALLRMGYIFNKKDAEFVALRGKDMGDYFEGAMKLKLGWFALGKLIGVDYRVTAEDVKGDGSVPPLPAEHPYRHRHRHRHTNTQTHPHPHTTRVLTPAHRRRR